VTGPGFNTLSNWKQLTWDAGEYTVFSNTISRTFTIAATGGRGLDGFEVFGSVYIPEPSAVFLLGLGGWLLLRRRHWLG
jgi:hypothetical protein